MVEVLIDPATLPTSNQRRRDRNKSISSPHSLTSDQKEDMDADDEDDNDGNDEGDDNDGDQDIPMGMYTIFNIFCFLQTFQYLQKL